MGARLQAGGWGLASWQGGRSDPVLPCPQAHSHSEGRLGQRRGNGNVGQLPWLAFSGAWRGWEAWGGGGEGSASRPLPAILGFGARDWAEKVQPQKRRLLDWAKGQEGMSWKPREWWGGRGDTLGTDCSEPEGPSRGGVEMLTVCTSGIWASGSLSRLDVMCSQLLGEQSPELLGPFTAFSLLPLSKTCCVTLS